MPHDQMPVENEQVRRDLGDLLEFLKRLLTAREKVVFDIGEHPIHLFKSDLCDQEGRPLPGIGFGLSEDAWLSFARLKEQPPPAASEQLEPWLRPEARPTPAKPPTLLTERVVAVSAEEATELAEAGFADPDAMAELPAKPGNAERWAVPLRPNELPEITEALDAYIKDAWQAWAAEESPRRAAIALYQRLYKAHDEISASGGEGSLELVVGIGIARWQHAGRRVNVPLIEQRAEFLLDESNGTLSISPRTVSPAPQLFPFIELGIPSAAELQRETTSRLENIAKDPDAPFGPFQPRSFQTVLETCAARLDASGTVLVPGDDLGPASEALRISPSFCILVRRRRDDVLRDDLGRLGAALDDGGAVLPETARRFVVPPPDAVPDEITPLNLSTGWGGGEWNEARREQPSGAHNWLFFPLPANEEQEEIARRLEQEDVHGVVVQGPPGTGKTHTIANIIGHWMAMGRRVLVSAHTAEALTAIRDKLPPAVRDLAIAVTHSDRDGARQLEEAVSSLATRVQMMRPREATQRVHDLHRFISEADVSLSEINIKLEAIARANLTEVPWRGGKARPREIAAWVAAQGDRHAWFPDLTDFAPKHELELGEAEVAELRALRRNLGEDLQYKAETLFAGPDALPSIGAVIAAHKVLRATEERREAERRGLPRPDFSTIKPADAKELLEWLEQLAAWRNTCAHYPWMVTAWEILAGGRSQGRLNPSELRAMLKEAATLAERGDTLKLQALELAEVAEAGRLGEALGRLAEGKRPFGFFEGFRGHPVKDAIPGARIAGETPRCKEDWAKLALLHEWRQDAHRFVARWNAFARLHGLDPLPEDRPVARDALGQLGKPAFGMLTLAATARARLEQLRTLFPYGIDAEAVAIRIDVSVAITSLRGSMGDAELVEAEQLRQTLRGLADQVGGAVGEALLQMADELGRPGVDDSEIAEQWRSIQEEVDRLAKLRSDLHRVSTLAAIVRDAGAERWATAIEQPLAHEHDLILPAHWRDAWDYARARCFLKQIADRTTAQQLTHKRGELVDARKRWFLELIELLTYLRLRERLTQSVLAELQKFLSALSKLPKTPGAKTTVRIRKIMRDSLQRAVEAIPCWIMPEWRVAEQLPAAIGSFDLVVIDEASQSNIMALPVVLRGMKLLIVGDDKQVSPVAIGIDDAGVNHLRNIYLKGQPLAYQIDPATSLYELGGMMYPGKVTVLREHFRCVEPIIRFSSARFYGGHLVPLRVPSPKERIDPPLVDIYVEDGCRRGDVNEAEAGIIVEEVKRAVSDTALNESGKRSIGVISLHAAKQTHLIYNQLLQILGPQTMSEHHIMCGDAATFQGQERDIIFLSMVHDEKTATKQTSRIYEQRYNVALSRARDRMVLVRSVTPSMLKAGDIKLEVLRHFQDPMAGGRIGQSDDVLAACQSGFEREVGKRLLEAGYRLRAQVPAGGYYIDFVVEGADDRRLAVELDGDSYHGPERWADDLRRPKALERVGWTFWRCWASEWEVDKEATFRDLAATLERRGIAPMGAGQVDGAALAEFRTVRHRPDAEEILEPPVLFADLAGADQLLPSRPPVGADKTVAIGDTVVVRYADGRAGSRTLQIVGNGSADGNSRIAATSPLAKAILGLRAEDEADVFIDGRPRSVLIEEIRGHA